MAEDYDIVIAGGGPVGVALALGLRGGAHRVALLEARARAGSDDARMIALSHGSRLILERLNAWQSLSDVTPIEHIEVSQQRRFGRVEISAAAARVPALGYVVGYVALQRSLAAALAGSGVEVMTGCAAREVEGNSNSAVVIVDCGSVTRQLDARLIVIADGGNIVVHHAH